MEYFLRNKIKGISAKFQKEAANCKFIEDTLSFIPITRMNENQNNSRRFFVQIKSHKLENVYCTGFLPNMPPRHGLENN